MKTSSLPQTKHAKLVYLLDHWDDIHDPNAVSTQGNPGEGTNTPHLGPMSRHPSVRELARCLAALNREAPVQYAHLVAFHTCEWRVHTFETTKRRKGGKLETVTHRERQRLVPAWVRTDKVRRAEDRLVVLFRGPVFIPEDLWDALTLSSAEIEAKRRTRRGRLRTVAA